MRFCCYTFIAISIIGLVAACTKQAPLPTLPEEKLVNILVDVHFAEAAMNTSYGTQKDSLAALYYSQIYEIHGIDSLVFQEQVALLRQNPAYLEQLYEKVFEKINAYEAASKKK